MTVKDSTLDDILVKLGNFGRYQRFVFALVSIAVILHSIVHIAFVFSAKDVTYRCEIPECEGANSTDFEPSWLTNAVPFKDNKPAKCDRFRAADFNESTCSSSDFDRNFVEKCDKFFYEPDSEVTIVNDFGLHCEDNTWKLTLVGTINNVGQFVGLFIAGVVSDRYGRRFLLIMGMVLCAFAGIARSFSTTYIMFIFLEFVDAAFGAGTYACGFILGVELVGPKKRVLSGTIISCCYAVGEVIVAGLAWYFKSWRPLILACYIPPLFLLSYFWLIPESVRWLLSQGREEEAKAIVRKAARVNKVDITEEDLEKLNKTVTNESPQDPFIQIFQSVPLLLRFINCCFCWITCTFLFYGLTLNSVTLAGNAYVEFILTSVAEIPAYIITYLTVDRWGRRTSQCTWFLITGISCLVSIFANQDLHWLQLGIYLFGKFGATAAFTVMYIITSEIFPTPLRHSMMGACSMVGRIGSMISPQMPLLGQVWKPLPLLLFGIMGTIAGLLSFLFPETLNTKLPDTIEEAENIGKVIDKKNVA